MSQKTFHLAPLHAYTCLCFYVRPNTCDKVLASLILRPVRFGCVITLPHTPLPFLSSIMLMPAILVTGALLFTLAGLALQRNYRKAKGYPFPPGPCRVPVIGNLFDMPRRMAWLSFSAMSQEYGEYGIYTTYTYTLTDQSHDALEGDLVYFKVLNQDIVVISSLRIINDLFNKRGEVYSDRYQSVSLIDL